MKRRGTGKLGAVLGAPTPQSTVDHIDHRELVRLDRSDPSKAEFVDQLVVQDDEGHEEFIPLHQGMGVNDIHKKIRRWGRTPKTVWTHWTSSRSDEFVKLARAAIPNEVFRKLPDTDTGVHDVTARIRFTINDHTFRAMAKIAFHYFLVHTRRGYRGSEPMFAAIRKFILTGGNKDGFFRSSGRKFCMPFGSLPGGRCIAPAEWCHVLVVDESEGVAVVYLQLFVGPGSVPTAHYITLGTIPSKLVLPDMVWGHVYRYETGDVYGRYVGRVEEVRISRTPQ